MIKTNKMFLASLCVFLLVVSLFYGLPVLDAVENYDETIVLVDDVEDGVDVYSLKNKGEIIERYESSVLMKIKEDALTELNNDYDIRLLDHRNELTVGGYTFNTKEGEPEFSPKLSIDGYEPGTKGIYIIDLVGPIARDWRPTLEDKGVKILNYVPNYAYRVRMTPEQARDVSELDFVDWVGIYHPGYKFQADLSPGEVEIYLVPGTSLESFQTIQDTVQVFSHAELRDGSYTLRAFIDSKETLHELASVKDVLYVSQYVEPELNDEMATQVIGGGSWFFDDEHDDPDNAYRKHGESGSYMNQIGYTGEGVVIAVADTGLGAGSVDGQHPDFQDRVIGGYTYDESGTWADEHGHGTHCAGSAAADTYGGTGENIYNDYYAAQGSAPGSELYSMRVFGADEGAQYVGPTDIYEIVQLAKTNADAYVHTNSWGAAVGGAYDLRAFHYDTATRDEEMVITVAAGNEGEGGIDSPATGKNVIGVGATQPYNPDEGYSNPENIASFSSRGWTLDNRIKPDVVAPGRSIYSTGTTSGYWYHSGTSMSTPAVAGAAAVVVEWYEENYGERPSPAMVRALLINTANQLDGNTGPIPNEDEGWGMVDISKLERPKDDPVSFNLYDQETVFTESSEENLHFIEADKEDKPLKFSLVWTDKEASFDTDGDRALINDLDLQIESPSGDFYRGNAFEDGWTKANSDAIGDFDYSGDGWDDTNNVENVYIPQEEVETGVYTVRVRASNIAGDAVRIGENSQDYSLVAYNAKEEVSGETPSVTLHGPDGGEELYAGDEEEITWSATGGDDDIEYIELSYSIDSGSSWRPIAECQDNTGSYIWTVDNAHSSECLVRVRAFDEVSREGVDTSEDIFEIIGNPPEPPDNFVVEHHGETGLITMFEEDFEEAALGLVPQEWTRSHVEWAVQDSDAAGGTAPELVLEAGSGSAWFRPRIYTQAIDTSGSTELELNFKHHVDYSGDFSSSFYVETSTDGNHWTTVWSEELDEDLPPEELTLEIDESHDVGSETLYISWYYHGVRDRINTWNIDDIILSRRGEEEGIEHNLLTWDASSDEAIGEVCEYNIYRSELESGPWDESTFIDNVSVEDLEQYEYVDEGKGDADDIYWWYVVRAVGENGLEEDNEDAVQEPGGEPGPLPPMDPIPENEATDVPLDPELSVLVVHTEEEPMDVSFYDAADDVLIDDESGVTSGERASVVWSGLSEGETYQWYAVAQDSQSETAQSPTRSFTTLYSGPLSPEDPEPEDDAVGVVLSPELSVFVDHSEGKSMSIEFYDAMEDSIIGVVDDVESGERAGLIFEDLEYETSYEWYAVADDGELSAESDIWSFTTISEEDSYFDMEIVSYDDEVFVGDEVRVNYTITNIGDIEDTQTIELKVDGAVEDTEEVTLEVDQEHEGHFTWMAEEEGTYTISVASEDDEDGVTVSVLEEVVQYELTIYAEEGGTTDPEPGTYTYEEGTEVELTASPNEGWFFVEWAGDETGTDTTIEITMDHDKEVTAHFEELEYYELTVNVDGEGAVEVDPEQDEYEEGTEVELKAFPEEGWYFDRWTGDLEGAERKVTIMMDSDKELTAHFEESGDDEHVLTINLEGKGTTEPAPGDHLYQDGVEVDVTAESHEGWYFDGWSGDLEGAERKVTVMMDSDKELTAHFGELGYYELDLDIDGDGVVEVIPDQEEYIEGTEVTLKANPDEGWYFSGWSGDLEGSERKVTIMMDSDKELTAHFEELGDDEHVLTIDVEGEGTTEPAPGDHVYVEGKEVEVEGNAAEGWTFVEWTGDHQSTDEKIYIVIDEDKEITALFEEELIYFELTVNCEGKGTVDIEPEQDEYEKGTEVNLKAIPEDSWSFVEWSGDVLEGQREEDEITVIMDEDKEVTVLFEELGKAYFEVSIVSPQDGEGFEEGDEIVVEYRVTNTGDVTGEQDIELYVNGVNVETETISLGPDESYQGEFTWYAEEEGEIEFEVRSSDQGETDMVSFTVHTAEDTDDPDDPEDDESFPWWILILLLVLIGVILVVLLLKKRDEEENDDAVPSAITTSETENEELEGNCESCGSELRYIEEYERWYCNDCEEYR